MRKTRQTRAVLTSLWIGGEAHGYEIMSDTGLKAGTVYPILHRLLEQGFVAVRMEKLVDALTAGRPIRKIYRVTPKGKRWMKTW